MSLSAYTSVESVLSLAPAIGSFSTVTSARIAGFISAVSVKIDSKMGRVYDTPFSATPPDIIRISSDLAMAMTLRSILVFAAPSNTEWYEKFAGGLEEGANADLADYAKGERTLVNSAGDVIARITTQNKFLSANKDYKPIFDMCDPSDWRVDPDRLDAEKNEDT